MENIKLIIESAKGRMFWGYMAYNDNLLAESAENAEEVKLKIIVIFMTLDRNVK